MRQLSPFSLKYFSPPQGWVVGMAPGRSRLLLQRNGTTFLFSKGIAISPPRLPCGSVLFIMSLPQCLRMLLCICLYIIVFFKYFGRVWTIFKINYIISHFLFRSVFPYHMILTLSPFRIPIRIFKYYIRRKKRISFY